MAGGTKAERLKADEALRECIFKKTGDEKLAKVMYAGVRLGGSPYFYNWYRWGYGWDYDRKYVEFYVHFLHFLKRGLGNSLLK